MSSTEAPTEHHQVPVQHRGIGRSYLLRLPAATTLAETPSRRLPLLLVLHGRGIDPLRFERLTGLAATANAAGLAVALPAAIDETWNDGRDRSADGPDDLAYLAAVIDDARHRLDEPDRPVAVAGMSNGASMAGRLAREGSRPLVAIAQVAATAWQAGPGDPRPGPRPGAVPVRPTPILHVHGTADPYWPYAGGMARGLRRRALMRRGTARTVGVDAWAAWWVAANGATEPPTTETSAPDLSVRTWRGPTLASDVVFWRVDGGGHTWPGSSLPPAPLFRVLWGRTTQAVDASRLIVEFVLAHAR